MDRTIVYPGAIPLDTDLLAAQQNAMIALGFLAQATLGTSTIADGLACTQTTVPGMSVNVGPGSIIYLTTVDGTAYGSLTTNTAALVKMGINTALTNLAITAPGVAGQSINYLIQAAFNESDGGSTVLPYYNAASPSTPYNGPGGAGTSQNTRRTQTITLTAVAGTPATTGTQTTPSPSGSAIGLWVVTVAYGATSVVNANITAYPGAPLLASKIPTLSWTNGLWTDAGTANAMAITLSPAPANLTALVGVPIKIKKIASGNTTATTLAVNGLTATAVVTADNVALSSGLWPASGIGTVVYDGTAFRLQTIVNQSGVSSVTTRTATTFWRQLPDGSIKQHLEYNLGNFPTGGAATITWPTAFPTKCYQPMISYLDASNGSASVRVVTYSLSGATINGEEFATVAQNSYVVVEVEGY